MKVSDYVVKFLKEKRVPCVFEVSGGMITHLLDSFNRDGKVRIVSMGHEQAGAFAADAIGRMTGIPGVALATSGPGATNLLTGIGSSYYDSSPTLFITGQVNRNEQKGNRPIRQLGFQETDIVSIARPITKAAWQVQTSEEVPKLLNRAFAVAMDGRPGPVLLDIPMDVQRLDISIERVRNTPMSTIRNSKFDKSLLKELFERLMDSKRPLIIVGGGIHSGRALELLRSFVKKIKIPVVNSLMAVDILPYNDPLRVGMIGSYGNRWANLAIGESDFLMVLGSRMDIRQTGSDTKAFAGDRVIFHVDCDRGEINNRVTGCHEIVSELRDFLTMAIHMIDEQEFPERTDWISEIYKLKLKWSDTKELTRVSGINPNVFMHQLSKVSGKAAAYITDVGQHQMWSAQSLEVGFDQRFLTSGGMGSMGFALPAAIGAALAAFPRPIVVIAGDGGFQHNIQELQTVVRNNLPIKMVIINNGCHGMVRQFQQSYFNSRYQSTLWGYSTPDFAQVASAYGIAGKTVKHESDIEQALYWLWQSPSKPVLLQVMVDTYANAYPKIAFGKPMTDMEPVFSPLDLEGS